MKKVLIVDDQTLNQTLLEAYVRQYGEQKGVELEIHTANNGLEAVVKAQSIPFDLIFMDVLMPVLNGIEATKHIHSFLPGAAIVIVSTEGDTQNQIEALRSGAKDYCVKPIIPEVFKRRLSLYLSMMGNEKNETANKRGINPFTNAVFCYSTTYQITGEDDLAQLWESMLLNAKNTVQTHLLSDLIRFLYQLGQVMLQRKVQPQIVIEEDEYNYFISVLNINILSPRRIERLLETYLPISDYRLKSNLLSFKMEKVTAPLFKENRPNEAVISTLPTAAPEPIYEKETQLLERYDFMESDDLNALEIKLGELSSQFVWMGNSEFDQNDVDTIIDAFGRISGILLLYSQTQELGMAIRDLSDTIQRDEAMFMTMAPQMSALCKSFNNDLITWFKSLFFEGAPSLHFMDASILSNIQMIRSFLEPAGNDETDEGDGFEFF